MEDERTHARTQAIRLFADQLREVRSAAGNPSFREMSGRSQAISHTTLHEAAQGHRLPSWSTTVEFAKACGRDPAELRASWGRADRAVREALASQRPPIPMNGIRSMSSSIPPRRRPRTTTLTPRRTSGTTTPRRTSGTTTPRTTTTLALTTGRRRASRCPRSRLTLARRRAIRRHHLDSPAGAR